MWLALLRRASSSGPVKGGEKYAIFSQNRLFTPVKFNRFRQDLALLAGVLVSRFRW